MQEDPGGVPHASRPDSSNTIPPDGIDADVQYELISDSATRAAREDAAEVEVVEAELEASNSNEAPDDTDARYGEPPRPETPRSYLERSEDYDKGASEVPLSSTSPSPGVFDSLKVPLLALAAAGGLAIAAWSYSSLEAVRAELGTVTAAKATVDKALADAQSRLTAAEKAVADVKAALSAAPLVAPAAPEAATPAEAPTAEPAP